MYRRYVKRIIDVILALTGLILASWLYLLIMITIEIDDPGPVFFSQKRVGIHHFASSWWDEKRRKEYAVLKARVRLDRIIHTPNRLLRGVLGQERYSKIKSKFKK